MKKTKKLKQKITTLALAVTLPITSSGILLEMPHVAHADSQSQGTFNTGKTSLVSISNGNFNSSSGTSWLGSFSGWTAEGANSNKSTAGIINVNNSSFQDRMSDTYYLSKNPGKSSEDDYILMINSRAEKTSDNNQVKKGYKSSEITLQKNSFYSFKVSFKTDTNYNSHTVYIDRKTPIDYDSFGKSEENPFKIGESVFNPYSTQDDIKTYTSSFSLTDDVYISFSHPDNIKNTYLKKSLTESDVTITEAIDNIEVFYQDEAFFGFFYQKDDTERQLYIEKSAVEYVPAAESVEAHYRIVLGEGVESIKTYTCEDFEYIKTSSNNGEYKVKNGTTVYTQKKEYDSLNDYTFGSVYLDGLMKDGKNYDMTGKQFDKISAKDWTNVYFYIATGDEEQKVNLNLMLGSRDSGSSGVVFFDDCEGTRYSENEFWKSYQSNQDNVFVGSYGEERKAVNIVDFRSEKEIVLPNSYNFDFEADPSKASDSLVDWDASFKDGGARVFPTHSPSHFRNETGFNFPGVDYTCFVDFDGEKVDALGDNNYVLALWAKDGYSQVTSKDISIHANEIYKITAKYKVSDTFSGNVFMMVKENDSLVKDKPNFDNYTLAELLSSGTSSNGDDEFTNKYNTIEFYVKGGPLYDSSFNMSLMLGKSDATANGCVVFDNIKVEHATSTQFNEASNHLALDSKTRSREFSNGNFNNVTVGESGLPSAENWTVETEPAGKNGVEKLVYSGVYNTAQEAYYTQEYEKLKTQGVEDRKNPYYFATYANPKSPNGQTTGNNIFVMRNIDNSYQKLSSESLNFEVGKDYNISFSLKTTSDAKLRVKLVADGNEDLVLFKSEFKTFAGWQKYQINVRSNDLGAIKAKLVLELGDSDNLTTGAAYFDDFVRTSENITIDEQSVNFVDLTNNFSKLPTNNITDNLDTSTHLGFKGETTSSYGTTAQGGVITLEGLEKLDPEFKVEKEEDTDDDFVYFLNTQGQATYTIQSTFDVDLSASSYYVLSFKLKTKFLEHNFDKDKQYEYGATVGLSGYQYMTGLKSEDGYEEFKMFLNASEASSAKFYMSIVSDADETKGSVAIYNLRLNTSTEEEYNAAVEASENKNYDVNTDRTYVAKADSADEDTENNTSSDTDTETESSGDISNNPAWLLIPSLIMAAALVIAIVGYFLRKIKIKKINTKRKETYDRKDSLNMDVVKQKAAAARDAEISAQRTTISKFQAELDRLEAEHKTRVITLRQNDKGKVSKETNKEFKTFAQKRTVLAEKIELLNRQLDELRSPEHLMMLERKVFAQEEEKRRELEKHSKQQNKLQEKQQKQDKKNDKKN